MNVNHQPAYQSLLSIHVCIKLTRNLTLAYNVPTFIDCAIDCMALPPLTGFEVHWLAKISVSRRPRVSAISENN